MMIIEISRPGLGSTSILCPFSFLAQLTKITKASPLFQQLIATNFNSINQYMINRPLQSTNFPPQIASTLQSGESTMEGYQFNSRKMDRVVQRFQDLRSRAAYGLSNLRILSRYPLKPKANSKFISNHIAEIEYIQKQMKIYFQDYVQANQQGDWRVKEALIDIQESIRQCKEQITKRGQYPISKKKQQPEIPIEKRILTDKSSRRHVVSTDNPAIGKSIRKKKVLDHPKEAHPIKASKGNTFMSTQLARNHLNANKWKQGAKGLKTGTHARTKTQQSGDHQNANKWKQGAKGHKAGTHAKTKNSSKTKPQLIKAQTTKNFSKDQPKRRTMSSVIDSFCLPLSSNKKKNSDARG